MIAEETMSKGDDRLKLDRQCCSGSVRAAAALLAVVVTLSACATSGGGSQWTGSYFKDPDSVWNAIELTLLEFDYEVSTRNREDGVIRAESEPDEDGAVILLAIDQVMRTEDQVKVYIKPSFSVQGPSKSQDLLKAAADAFLKSLDAKLGG
jgi:hypothetical protein